ncbi:phage head closure protein [Clostridium perfringens]|uniref:phage head closure protein n=1 Tax=Clostridium perfringens TaxID=1502 RepID=UPI00096A8635|nr:phage head closure protein [Clostridium perfringens]EHR9037932.1 phage head closure protein [Clostridium perfringens]MDK0537614.1 phage head closure protein [Clostridium perfringens]RHN26819.1 head-tail adaptor protein [Clostridium perfringens]HAT4150282.1 phage head closure protein [Clostridium perfringens]HAT4296610.1 phage head closure protein [Clostridium perfringens]
MQRFRERITFQTLTTTTNENGFQSENWVDYYTCWSDLKSMNGREYFESLTNNTELIVSFRCRYCAKLNNLDTKKVRILHKNKTYDINYVYNVQDSNSFIEFKCKSIS